MKMEMAKRQKQRYLHTYDLTKEGYMQWRRMMEMFAGNDTTDDEMEHDLQQAMDADEGQNGHNGQNGEEDEKKYKC